MQKILSLPALVALVALSTPLVAQSQQPDAAQLFSQLDANQDGALAGDEIPEDRRALFERLLRIGDADKDGKLNAAEFAAALNGPAAGAPAANRDRGSRDRGSRPERGSRPGRPEGGPERLFARLDANGDGKLTADEVPEQGRERIKQLISRADKDGDGALTLAEFTAAGPPRPEGRPAGSRPAGKGKAAADAPRPDPARLFARMDTNGDGKLTADDATGDRKVAIERMLKRGDTDGDQALSREEFAAMAANRPPRPEAVKTADPPQDAAKPAAPPAEAEQPEAAKQTKQPGQPNKKAQAKKPENPKKAAKQAMAARLVVFSQVDADGDGQLSSEEISGSADAIRKLDKDGDGVVSAQELVGGKPKKNKE